MSVLNWIELKKILLFFVIEFWKLFDIVVILAGNPDNK